MEKPKLSAKKQFELDREKMRLSIEQKAQNKEYAVALKRIENLTKQLDQLTRTKGVFSTYEIKATTSKKHEATAVALISDTHIEENVTPESVDFSNEYTLEIAKKRMEAVFRNILKLVLKEQQDARINTLVLAILGDIITGNIHEELPENCEVPPAEATVIAQSYLANGIDYILANSKLNLVIPCCIGNHSRITDTVHVAKEYALSLEWIIYCNLAERYRGNKRVTFVLSKSYFTWVKVYDYPIRFHHGHAMKYGSGVGGITIPVNKAIARYDLAKTAYLDCFGHFHNPMSTSKFVSNGCLIGDTPYGKRLGFTGKPQQQFFLLDKVHGKTVSAPIFVD